jgi:hypothetical protein
MAKHKNHGDDEDHTAANATTNDLNLRRSSVPAVLMESPNGVLIVYIDQRDAARALARMYDMRMSDETLQVLSDGISSCLIGSHDTFMFCEFKVANMISFVSDFGGEDDEEPEEPRPSTVPSSLIHSSK